MPRFSQTGVDAQGNPVLRQWSPAEEAARDAEEAAALLPPSAAQQRLNDLALLRGVTGDAIVLLVRTVEWMLATPQLDIVPASFRPAIRQAYTDLKVIADRLDPPP